MFRAIEATPYKETKEGTYFIVLVRKESLIDKVKRFINNGILKGVIRLDDGRTITSEQRKKAYATMADIAIYSGNLPEEVKEILKYYYIGSTGEKYFSLSDCSVSTAKDFISYLIDFCLEWNIPLSDTLLNRTDDIDKAVYSSLKHKRCVLCGLEGEIHHFDAIGMGRNRNSFDDSNLKKICLCRMHHTEAHAIGVKTFEEKYHVYGILFNE